MRLMNVPTSIAPIEFSRTPGGKIAVAAGTARSVRTSRRWNGMRTGLGGENEHSCQWWYKYVDGTRSPPRGIRPRCTGGVKKQCPAIAVSLTPVTRQCRSPAVRSWEKGTVQPSDVATVYVERGTLSGAMT